MTILKPKQAILILEDGTKYHGWSFSPLMTSIGEVIFNTGITGYQEIITDPSYQGQIVTFTYPELGNTGINKEDNEAKKPYVTGIIAKNLTKQYSNWRSNNCLINYLNLANIIHIYGIDTRALTKHLRKTGTMNGCISTEIYNTNYLHNKLKASPKIEGQDLVQLVSTKIIYKWYKSDNAIYTYNQYIYNKVTIKQKNLNILILDFGTKYNILRSLSQYIQNIIIIPAKSEITTILKYQPDGIVLSNGPGDPEVISYGIKLTRTLLKYKIPIFGICMGHQILGLAFNLKAFKLKFGHRGLNHPIGLNNKTKITSQNHGFAIENPEIINNAVALIEINFNDKTVGAISNREDPCFSVQYHPEANPGPHDSEYLFLHFIRIIQMIKQYPYLINNKI